MQRIGLENAIIKSKRKKASRFKENFWENLKNSFSFATKEGERCDNTMNSVVCSSDFLFLWGIFTLVEGFLLAVKNNKWNSYIILLIMVPAYKYIACQFCTRMMEILVGIHIFYNFCTNRKENKRNGKFFLQWRVHLDVTWGFTMSAELPAGREKSTKFSFENSKCSKRAQLLPGPPGNRSTKLTSSNHFKTKISSGSNFWEHYWKEDISNAHFDMIFEVKIMIHRVSNRERWSWKML